MRVWCRISSLIFPFSGEYSIMLFIRLIQFERKNNLLVSKKASKKESLLLTNLMRSFAYVEAYRMLATRIRLTMDQSQMKNRENL